MIEMWRFDENCIKIGKNWDTSLFKIHSLSLPINLTKNFLALKLHFTKSFNIFKSATEFIKTVN